MKNKGLRICALTCLSVVVVSAVGLASTNVVTVPEPSTISLLVVGLGGLLAETIRRMRN